MVYRLAVGLSLAVCLGCVTPAAAQQIDPPKKIKNVEPVYPESAQRARAHGDVVIKATIGADGKVTGAEIVTSIPLLDEPALNAVRQWEYAPTLVKGVPTPVVMTVTVHFSLHESSAAPPSRSGPLVLDRDGADWTIGGTPLSDDNLRFWLHYVMRTEPDKELYVHAPGTSTWGELVNVLSSATAAGVEKLYVFVGNLDPKQGVRVWLDPVLQKTPGVDLPVSDVASQSKGAGFPITIPRSGSTASAKTSMQRATAGASVRLRVDRSRHVSDAWEVLRLGSRRQVEGIGVAVRLPPGAVAASNVPVSPQQQREWEAVETLDGSVAESVPILEKFVTRNPNVVDAQFKLALAYEARATGPGASPEVRRRDWEAAVRHYALTAELHQNEEARFVSTWKIAQLYGADALNDRVQAERYARMLVDEHPTKAQSHIFYAQMLREAGDIAGAANVMRHGRTVAAMDVTALMLSMQYLIEQVQATRNMPRQKSRELLDEASSVADAILGHPDTDETLYRLTAMAKSMVLDLEAERVADTLQQRLAMIVESDRWDSHRDDLKRGAPPPIRKLSPAETAALECEALGRWSSRLADEQPAQTAVAAVQKYISERPSCYATHLRLSELLARVAHDSPDPKGRAADLERAVSELEQVIDLAPTALDRSGAFNQVVELSGPKELNHPERVEPAARSLVKRQPDDPVGHYTLAAVLFRTGRTGDGEKALRTARTSIKATPSTRADMASQLLWIVRRDADLPTPAARRLFNEASTLLTEAEKLSGANNDPAVISARIVWLNLSAERFEKDPARAVAQRELAKALTDRLQPIK
jgi:TonB family protein